MVCRGRISAECAEALCPASVVVETDVDRETFAQPFLDECEVALQKARRPEHAEGRGCIESITRGHGTLERSFERLLGAIDVASGERGNSDVVRRIENGHRVAERTASLESFFRVRQGLLVLAAR